MLKLFMLKITIVAKNIFLFFLQIQGDKIMRIRNLIMTGLIASGGFALTSCKKVPFQEMSTKYIPLSSLKELILLRKRANKFWQIKITQNSQKIHLN